MQEPSSRGLLCSFNILNSPKCNLIFQQLEAETLKNLTMARNILDVLLTLKTTATHVIRTLSCQIHGHYC